MRGAFGWNYDLGTEIMEAKGEKEIRVSLSREFTSTRSVGRQRSIL